ncbi:MAG: glycosyltransferase [Balneolales bacterium]|nr:glycosyltransferase [Balneolales bacterium]
MKNVETANPSISQQKMTDLSKTPIVMISMSRWDGDFSSAAWSIARTFSQSQPVIYVDYPYTVTDFIREYKQPNVKERVPALLFKNKPLRKLEEFGGELYALTPPVMMPAKRFSKGYVYNTLNTFNDHRLAKTILKAVKELGFTDFISYNSFNPQYLTVLPSYFKPVLNLYQSRDDINALEPYLRKHGVEGEITAIQNADVSFATSTHLRRTLCERTGADVKFLPNAASFETFRKAYDESLQEPADLQKIPKPRIGYTGNICHRQDYPLIKALSAAHPDKSIVLVGPKNFHAHTNIQLEEIPNVYFTGPKKVDELPAYLQHFDVLILPFLCNDVTRSIYPLKINEYLASGKPVVATPFSEDIRSFSDVIQLESSHELFTAAVETQLKTDSTEKSRQRYERASLNTWQNRVEQIRKWMHKACINKNEGS